MIRSIMLRSHGTCSRPGSSAPSQFAKMLLAIMSQESVEKADLPVEEKMCTGGRVGIVTLRGLERL